MKNCKKCNKEFEPQKGLLNFCSIGCRNSRVQTEEIRSKKSTSAKLSEKVRKANQQPRARKQKYPRKTVPCLRCGEPIETLQNVDRKYHSECWRLSSGGYRENSTIKHKSVYKGFSLDSGAEKLFAMLLDSLVIKWTKNSTTYFNYVGEDGKKRKYYPDFYLPDYGKWVEVKGKFYADKDVNLSRKLESVDNISIIYSTEITEQKIKEILAH